MGIEDKDMRFCLYSTSPGLHFSGKTVERFFHFESAREFAIGMNRVIWCEPIRAKDESRNFLASDAQVFIIFI